MRFGHLKYTLIVCTISRVGQFHSTMAKRINVILPDKTVAVLDRVTTKGNRSRFIDRAVLHYVEAEGRQNLRSSSKQATARM